MEKRNIKKEGLLERLTEETGCIYMSDLRLDAMKEHCSFLLSKIETSEYSAEVWKDAANYMIGIRANEEDAEETKQRLLRFLGTKEKNIKKNV